MPDPSDPELDALDPAGSPARLLVEAQLAEPGATWTMGARGGHRAECGRTPGEPVSRGPNSAVTASGGVRIVLPDDTTAIAYECPDPTDPLRWEHGVAFCLPAARASTADRRTVTELGPDSEALRPQDTGALLFDLGRGGAAAEVLLRTADPDALAALRVAVGSVAPDHLENALAGPRVHHVVRTAVGRVELFGLRRRRPPTVPRSAPVPDGLVPCALLRPPHPAADPSGRPAPFDHERHTAFQALLVAHGDPVLGVLKADVVDAVRSGHGPGPDPLPIDGPAARATIAVTVRQLAITDGTSAALTAWRSRHGAG